MLKDYTVFFSAPWHTDNAGYCAHVKAFTPEQALKYAIIDDNSEATAEDFNSVTCIGVIEGHHLVENPQL